MADRGPESEFTVSLMSFIPLSNLPQSFGRKTTAIAALLATVLVLPAERAAAQSLDIGLNFAEFVAVQHFAQGGEATTALTLTGDFRVGPGLGVQLDLGGESFRGDFIGQADLHLYIAPNETLKYGVYASLADANDRELTMGEVGVEVIAEIGGGLTLEGSAGIGMIHSLGNANIDYVTVTGGILKPLSERTSIYGQLTLAVFEESAFSANSYDLVVGVKHDIGQGRVSINAVIGVSGLEGRDSAPAETVANLGVTWRFGGLTGQDVGAEDRAFQTRRPVRAALIGLTF